MIQIIEQQNVTRKMKQEPGPYIYIKQHLHFSKLSERLFDTNVGSWSLLLFPSHILLFNDAFCGWYLCRPLLCELHCILLHSNEYHNLICSGYFSECVALKPASWISDQGGRGSRVHNRLAVVIGAGSLVVEVATALDGQWVSEWVSAPTFVRPCLAKRPKHF